MKFFIRQHLHILQSIPHAVRNHKVPLASSLPCAKQRAYHWRSFTPANNQKIWPLQWCIIAPRQNFPGREKGDISVIRFAHLKSKTIARPFNLTAKKMSLEICFKYSAFN